MSKKIFGLGSAALDFRIKTADMGTDYTEKLLAREIDILPGGSVANCLAMIGSLGGNPVWLGKLGNDWIGSRIVSQLEYSGISCDGVIQQAGLYSPFNLAAYAGEERRRVGGWLLPNSLASIDKEDTEHWLSMAGAGDWLVVEIGEIPLKSVLAVCRQFSSKGAKIAIDVDLDPVLQCGGTTEIIEKIFSLADILIPNRNALLGIFGEKSPEELALLLNEKYGSLVVVTAGEVGAWACQEGKLMHEKAPETKVIDTVGAGDAFHGGLIWALSKGKTIQDSLKTACECGAMACRFAGARQHLESSQSVENLPK